MSGAAAAPVVCDVLVAGGGPCGLMLANELGRRGISLLLSQQNLCRRKLYCTRQLTHCGYALQQLLTF